MTMGLCFNGLLMSSILATMQSTLVTLTRKVSKGKASSFSITGKQLATVDVVPPPTTREPLCQLQPLYAKVEHLAVSIGRTYGLILAVQLLVHGLFVVAMTCYVTDVSLVIMDEGPAKAYTKNILMLLIHLISSYRVLASAEAFNNAVKLFF
jgi:hypothetical protein